MLPGISLWGRNFGDSVGLKYIKLKRIESNRVYRSLPELLPIVTGSAFVSTVLCLLWRQMSGATFWYTSGTKSSSGYCGGSNHHFTSVHKQGLLKMINNDITIE